MALKYNTKSYKNKIERQKAVSKFATKAGLNLKDARIYYRQGLTPAEAKRINKLVENKGLGTKLPDVATINEAFGLKIKSKTGKVDKAISKEAMAGFLKTNKKAGNKSKDVFNAFERQSIWNPSWSTTQASMNNVKSAIKESGQWRQFTGQMLAHRGFREQWTPTHIEYNGGGSDNNGQFTQYTYTSYKDGQPYRKAIIKIYNSKDDVKIEYLDL